MNKSYNKIRHIHNSNLLLEKRYLNEGIRVDRDFDEFISDREDEMIFSIGVDNYAFGVDNYALYYEPYPKKVGDTHTYLVRGGCESSNPNKKGITYDQFVSSIKGKSPKIYKVKKYEDDNDKYLKLSPVVPTTNINPIQKLGYQRIEYKSAGDVIFVRSWGSCGFKVYKNGGGFHYFEDFLAYQISQKMTKELVCNVKVKNNDIIINDGSQIFELSTDSDCVKPEKKPEKKPEVTDYWTLTMDDFLKTYPDLNGNYKLKITHDENFMYLEMTPVSGGTTIYIQSNCTK
jgi:hypothetical protein